jgi:serine/threonine-protein kinase RsbW
MKSFALEEKKIFSANLEMLHPMLHWIKDFAKEARFSTSDLQKIELASEEALVNIIRHGYQNQNGDIEISLYLISNQYLEIVIKDQGKFFNPLAENRIIDKTASLEERNEGGLGILLIRSYMDDVEYEHQGKSNILTLRKNI